MADDDSRYDRVAQTLSRRQALAGGATLLTAGGTLVWVGEPASAAVDIEGFTAENQSWQREQVSPVVNATIRWQYDAGNSVVTALRLRLSVGDTVVAEERLSTDRTVLDGQTDLSGRVTDSDSWATSDFDPDVASSVSREVAVTVEMAVLGQDDSVIVADSATDTAALTVEHPQQSQYTATVGGTATFEAADN